MNIKENPFFEMYTNKFLEKFNIKNKNEDELYENFVNYLIAITEYKKMNYLELDKNFEISDFIKEMHFGANNTTGIDGCFFLFSDLNTIVSLSE